MFWDRGGEDAAEATLWRNGNLWVKILPSLPTHKATPTCLHIISHSVSSGVEWRLPIIVQSIYYYAFSFGSFSSPNVLSNISLYPNLWFRISLEEPYHSWSRLDGERHKDITEPLSLKGRLCWCLQYSQAGIKSNGHCCTHELRLGVRRQREKKLNIVQTKVFLSHQGWATVGWNRQVWNRHVVVLAGGL